MKETAPLHSFRGIGAKTEELFRNLGIQTAGDLLTYFPRDYMSYPEPCEDPDRLAPGKNQALRGFFKKSPVNRHYRSMNITMGYFYSGEHAIEVFWYRMPYISKSIRIGVPYVIYGRVGEKNGKLRFEQPALHDPVSYERLTRALHPLYSLTKGISNNLMEKTVHQAMDLCFPLSDPLEFMADHLRKFDMEDYTEAVRDMHFPDSREDLNRASRRFAYEEFLVFFLAVRMENAGLTKEKNPFHITKTEQFQSVKSELPFSLTKGQEDALQDLLHDFHGDTVEERLIQGDVGSGKTIVAFLAMVLMAENGYQSAIMAPTEVLAEQHRQTFRDYIEQFHLPYRLTFLTGSLTAKEKAAAYAAIASGESQFIIGTHALIQEAVSYRNLALVVTDEQHRFGVKQRDAFLKKGQHPFSVVMSATPIPRTLALILYDGMNISSIRDVPKERLRVKTAVIPVSKRKTAWHFIAKQVQAMHQAYVICPLVEASENMDLENVTDYAKKMTEAFGNRAKVGILHGRMKAEEKAEIMSDFAANRIQILVSTTVVEVGVNVPNATVMMVENADRFGLAQLHQLRGRVGRGSAQSYCILMNSRSEDDGNSSKRLDIMNHSYDGFEIAEEDLKLRGPGDARGIRQSGDSPFTYADIYKASDLLGLASGDANEILKDDPTLQKPEHSGLRRMVEQKSENTYTNL